MGESELIQIGAQYGAAGMVAVVMYLILVQVMNVVKDNSAVIAKLLEKMDRVLEERGR